MGNNQNTIGENVDSTDSKQDSKLNIRNADDIKYSLDELKCQKGSNESTPEFVRLLVISDQPKENFYALFEGSTLSNGKPIVVEQAAWNDVTITSFSDKECVCTLKRPSQPIANTPQEQKGSRMFTPNYLLLRSFCNAISTGGDHRSILFGFMHAQLPSINRSQSFFFLMSEYYLLDRPLMLAELVRLNRLYGQKYFPIVTHNYYPVSEEMIITPQYPLVVKIGPGHAGFGKMLLQNHKQFGDFKSIVACTDEILLRFLPTKNVFVKLKQMHIALPKTLLKVMHFPVWQR
ncbi:synapsin [Reticulomyxa filosa]|uniref:Synapsin n=1 Tax=Reticulomyxa filosa TaxID=46433 RepID=X6MG62_RETFI|nr:synapsin [Reticulomyxa filosa]|eukprot:ETO12671.1 synapsin [Reticulomyxa filosa]